MKINKLFIIIIFYFLNIFNIIAAEYVSVNSEDIVIVMEKDKIEKYKKIFANFLPNEIFLDKNNNLIISEKEADFVEKYYKEYYSKYDEKKVEEIINIIKENDIFVCFAERYTKINDKKYLEIVLVTKKESLFGNPDEKVLSFKIENEYKVLSINPYDDVYIEFYNAGNDSVHCFFGILTNTDCMNKATYGGGMKINKNDFKKYIMENKLDLLNNNYFK